jgi:hypothetical protein
LAAFCRFYRMTPDDYWNLKLDERAAMADLMVEASKKGA